MESRDDGDDDDVVLMGEYLIVSFSFPGPPPPSAHTHTTRCARHTCKIRNKHVNLNLNVLANFLFCRPQPI